MNNLKDLLKHTEWVTDVDFYSLYPWEILNKYGKNETNN